MISYYFRYVMQSGSIIPLNDKVSKLLKLLGATLTFINTRKSHPRRGTRGIDEMPPLCFSFTIFRKGFITVKKMAMCSTK